MRLVGVYRFTEHDDDDAFYTRRLHESCLPPKEAAADRGQGRRRRVGGNLQECIHHGDFFSLGEPRLDEGEGEEESSSSSSKMTAVFKRRKSFDEICESSGGRRSSVSSVPPVTEDEVTAALRARGFKIFYGGDTEDVWLDQLSQTTTSTTTTTEEKQEAEEEETVSATTTSP